MKSVVIALLVTSVAFASEKLQTFTVTGPTIVAFCPVTQAQVDQDQDLAEVMDDFSTYAAQAEQHYRDSSVAFRQVYEQAFRLKEGSRVTVFHPHRDCGFYFVSPGHAPLVDRGGVKTSDEIYDEANKYFHTVQKPSSHR